jgi:Flp pilus assembly protein TadD
MHDGLAATDADPALLMQQGRDAFARGDHPAASAAFEAARAAGWDDAELHRFRGYLARTAGDLEAAEACYIAALAHSPADAQLHNNLAEIRQVQGHHAEALALFRRSLALDPALPEVAVNLGSLLMDLRRPDQALPYLQQALALNPALAPVHELAATALAQLNRYPETLAHYRAATRLQPDNHNAAYLDAMALLALGDYAAGWRLHEVRWQAELGRDLRGGHDAPTWLGEAVEPGQIIMLHAEQGFGDTLQFVRYVPLVAARGLRVVLQVQDALVPLLDGLPGTDSVVGRKAAPPPHDLHCSLMSLPYAFRGTIPADTPYVEPPPARVLRWQQRVRPVEGRRHIAFAWSSAPAPWNRNMTLQALAPLLARPDCVFHVAQTLIGPEDRALLESLPHVVDHSRELADFADTAALLTLMDQVISIDTALAHLAGALAKPTWTLLPLGADYRWMTEGSSCPWYPTMRLFRQPRLHDWAAVVAAVDRALDA